MATMRAAVYVGDGRIEVQEMPVPAPAPGEVLVEVAYCGICGTDLHLVLEQYARPGSVLGHEWSGTVVDTGQPVVATPEPGCGRCRACRRGRPSVCRRKTPPDHLSFRGAFGEYVTVAADRLLAIPTNLSARVAALTEPTAIAMHTSTISGVEPGDRVLVTGAGPVGLLTTAVLRARGISDITVSEPAPARRERALEVGARRVLTPDALPRGPLGQPVDDPYDVVFECSGNAKAAESALDQLDCAGTMVLVGTGFHLPRLNHNRAIVLELTVVGAYNYDADGFARALALLDSGALPLEHLIEADDIGLADLQPTMERLGQGELPGKVMVCPR